MAHVAAASLTRSHRHRAEASPWPCRHRSAQLSSGGPLAPRRATAGPLCVASRLDGQPVRPTNLLATLAGPLFRTALGPPFLLTPLLGGMLSRWLLNSRLLGRLVSRRALPSGSLLWSRLLSRSIGLRLVAGRRRRLHCLLRPLPARSLLRSRLLSRGIGLRLGPRWLRSPSTLRPFTLDGWTFLPGRRWRLRRLLALRASGRRSRLLTLLALPSGSGRPRLLYALGFHGSLGSAGRLLAEDRGALLLNVRVPGLILVVFIVDDHLLGGSRIPVAWVIPLVGR